MFSNRTAIRSTFLASLLVAGLALGAAHQAHADVEGLTYSANINCNALTEVVTIFNSNTVDTVANIVLQSSLQNTSLTATVPAQGATNVTFNIVVGERIDKIILRNQNLDVLLTTFTDIVITGTGDCKRPAFDLVELTGYSLTCNGGVTHAAITLENKGDYTANIGLIGSPRFTSEQERLDAEQQGLVFTDSESFTMPPLTTKSSTLDFKVIDLLEVEVTNGMNPVFTDGPRIPAAGEGCVSAPTTTVGETIPEDTTPEDTTPTNTLAPESGSATPTTVTEDATTVPTTAAAADQSPRALPVTGRGSMPIGMIGSLLFAAGFGLVRTTRRRSA